MWAAHHSLIKEVDPLISFVVAGLRTRVINRADHFRGTHLDPPKNRIGRHGVALVIRKPSPRIASIQSEDNHPSPNWARS